MTGYRNKTDQAKMKNVAILGGAFNPITLGHTQVAEFVLEAGEIFDEVWLLPCYIHIYNKKMADAFHRLAMCELATSKDKRIKVFDYEIKNKFTGGTYYLIKQLLKEDFVQNRFDFSLIIGQDNANTFNKWVKHRALERLIRFIIVPRQGVDIDKSVNWYYKSPHIYLAADKPIMEVSSTRVRELLKTGKYTEASKFVDPDVLQYIRRNGLYCE